MGLVQSSYSFASYSSPFAVSIYENDQGFNYKIKPGTIFVNGHFFNFEGGSGKIEGDNCAIGIEMTIKKEELLSDSDIFSERTGDSIDTGQTVVISKDNTVTIEGKPKFESYKMLVLNEKINKESLSFEAKCKKLEKGEKSPLNRNSRFKTLTTLCKNKGSYSKYDCNVSPLYFFISIEEDLSEIFAGPRGKYDIVIL